MIFPKHFILNCMNSYAYMWSPLKIISIVLNMLHILKSLSSSQIDPFCVGVKMEGYWLFLLSRNNREEPCQQSSVLKSKSWCHHQHIHYFPGLLFLNNHPKSNKKQKSLGPNWEASCDLPLSHLLPNNPKKEDSINYAGFPQSDHFLEGQEQ